MYCGKCGTENQDGAKFCKGCGATLGRAAQASASGEEQTIYLGQDGASVNYQAGELQGEVQEGQDAWQGQGTWQGQTVQQEQSVWQGQNMQQDQNAWQEQNEQQRRDMLLDNLLKKAATESREPIIPSGYEPIGMWGYFGYSLLFSIPLVGLIMQLIFAFGGTSNINLRNFARAQFCVVILWSAVVLIFLMPVISSFMSYMRW